MAESIFIFRLSGDEAADFATLSLDAAIAETHSREAVVTEHPVESGSDISDHVRPRPMTLSADCLISNTPIGSTPDANRARNAFHQLEEAWRKGTLFTILTGLKQYENMVLTSLSVPRDSRTGEALKFSASFREVQIVSTQTVTLPKTSVNAAKPKAKNGKQTGTPASPQVQKSLAAKLKDALF